MSGDIKFHIITDDPVVAMLDLFASTPSRFPRWIRVTDDPTEILALPNGSKCRAQWYSARGRTLTERAWRERRFMGGLDFISTEDEERILDWFDRRDQVTGKPAVPLVRPEPELANMPLTQRWI
ncbi:hypothetical protein P6U16_08490 [Rhizobium sp. 32-5/1]|uniref:hypothetical protein n=1 Tax=Rhizobium sp. 32-5/1 TaxID=3019602 RepID=UPI00240DE009|nr:hypothetical protein [Rhizobium sp. 32-5/1]WEZ84596.1 hypothetical protein P6U16_08490 [Rhizobium sp. 32-5/1]